MMEKHLLHFVFLLVLTWSFVICIPDKKAKDNFPSDVFHNKTIITDHQLHDFDHNKLLDGLEIMAALQDSLEHYLGDAFSKEEKMKHYIDMTDEVLEEDDLDKDGFLSYVEYMHSQKRTASPTTILDKTAKDKKGSKKST
ncbi:Hypothetical predicted protein [Pelobates cultripes]|uniref:Uncharacterized protein n=1 Tax=Pelobates cultripes TaxID=61616 RepID=A0AAD1VRW1_PELCU|nr:Hypothetical predicted protein [Pelobates cultripes]